MKTSTSLFAKALASENIHVAFDVSAKTATFDVESRTLIIPDWKVSDSVRDMIVAHEVAHALHTPAEQLQEALQSAKTRKLDPNGYKACVNVVEDARIERLIKEKFPGCRRDFYAGYKELHEIDLFQIRNIHPDDFTIIDKINLHFKFGLFGLMTFTFTAPEQRLMDRIAAVKTFEDVVTLADELYRMEVEDQKQKGKGNQFVGGEGKSRGDLSDALEKLERDGNMDKSGRGQNSYENFPNVSYALPGANSDVAIIPFKIMLADDDYMIAYSRNVISKYNPADEVARYDAVIEKSNTKLEQYRLESKSTVRELVAQFERRKAAEEIRRERQKPTGAINPDRLHQFKTHDDIFLRNLVRHEGKKHGMVMLIDWSGSMRDCIDGVVRQVLLLTWFCRKAKIPYEVMCYTQPSGFEKKEHRDIHKEESNADAYMAKLYGKEYRERMGKERNSLHLSDVSLRQVFSSSMTDEETKQMERLLWRIASMDSGEFDGPERGLLRHSVTRAMGMVGTPSVEALIVMHDYIPKFRAATGSQIVDFIFVTDGEPGGMSRLGRDMYIPVRSVRVQFGPTGRTLTVNACDKRGRVDTLQLQCQYFMVDEIRRLGCVTVGFSIGNMSGVGQHLMRKIVRRSGSSNTMQQIEAADKPYESFYKKENFVPGCPELTPGFDEYYVVRPVKPLYSEESELNSTNSTLTRIRNQFIKSLTGRKCSRVFLSRFIDLIAGRKVNKFRLMG